MSIVIISLISVFLAYISKYKKTRWCFELAMIILVSFFGFRYDFGNDYAVYLANFDSVQKYSESIIDLEYGWILLNKLFSYIGFPGLVFFVTIIQFYSVYYYIKHYVDAQYRWFVLLYYIINVSLMIHSLSGLRQTLAMSLLIFSLPYIYSKKYLYASFFILLAAQFHSSAYFMFILPITTLLIKISKRKYIYILLSIFLISFFFREIVMRMVSYIIQYDNVARYEAYLDQSNSIYSGSGIGIILQLFVLISILINDKHDITMKNWLLKLYQISFVFIPLYLILPIFNRVQMYFLLFGIGGVPMLIKSAKMNVFSCIIILLYLLMLLMGFSSILTSGPYSNYVTIFSENIYL